MSNFDWIPIGYLLMRLNRLLRDADSEAYHDVTLTSLLWIYAVMSE